MKSPLEQFEVTPLLYFFKFFEFFGVTLTNFTFFAIIAFLTVFLLSLFTIQTQFLVPTLRQFILESLYEFILNLLVANVGLKASKYFPLVFTFFVFILTLNLIGLFPYSYTLTSQIIVTVFLGFSLLIGLVIVGFRRHGFNFFSLFFPKEAPVFLAFLLVPIEILSFLSRPFSLSIRLFANMTAGHVLLKILTGFAVVMLAHFFSTPFLINLLAYFESLSFTSKLYCGLSVIAHLTYLEDYNLAALFLDNMYCRFYDAMFTVSLYDTDGARELIQQKVTDLFYTSPAYSQDPHINLLRQIFHHSCFKTNNPFLDLIYKIFSVSSFKPNHSAVIFRPEAVFVRELNQILDYIDAIQGWAQTYYYERMDDFLSAMCDEDYETAAKWLPITQQMTHDMISAERTLDIILSSYSEWFFYANFANGSFLYDETILPGVPASYSSILLAAENFDQIHLYTYSFLNEMTTLIFEFIFGFFSTVIQLLLTFILALIPLLVLFFFIALELFVAILQAYVFSILMILYLKDIIDLH